MYLSKQDYGLWNEDDSKNIESLVLEAKNDRKMDNTKLLLDVIPRSALGYEFSLEKVYYYCTYLFDYIYWNIYNWKRYRID
jgi:hypothetical protein